MKKLFVIFSLFLLPMIGQAKTEIQQNAATTPIVDVRKGGIINAEFCSAVWRIGKLEVTIEVTTPMVRRQFRITDSSAKDSDDKYARISNIIITGINQEPGRDYYIITDHDIARIKMVLYGMPVRGTLNQIRVDMSLSGTKEWVVVRNIVW